MSTNSELTKYFQKHKAVVDRILYCKPSDYAEILNLKEPISWRGAAEAFEPLSNWLSPEANFGVQYKHAQEAHDSKYHG